MDIPSLFNMVEQLFSIEIKGPLEAAGGQISDETEQCYSFCKLATECPDIPWVSYIFHCV